MIENDAMSHQFAMNTHHALIYHLFISTTSCVSLLLFLLLLLSVFSIAYELLRLKVRHVFVQINHVLGIKLNSFNF